MKLRRLIANQVGDPARGLFYVNARPTGRTVDGRPVYRGSKYRTGPEKFADHPQAHDFTVNTWRRR